MNTNVLLIGLMRYYSTSDPEMMKTEPTRMRSPDGSYSPGLQTHGHHFSEPEEEGKNAVPEVIHLVSRLLPHGVSEQKRVLRRPVSTLAESAGSLISAHAPERSGCFVAHGWCGSELPGTRVPVSFPVCVGNVVDSENGYNSCRKSLTVVVTFYKYYL